MSNINPVYVGDITRFMAKNYPDVDHIGKYLIADVDVMIGTDYQVTFEEFSDFTNRFGSLTADQIKANFRQFGNEVERLRKKIDMWRFNKRFAKIEDATLCNSALELTSNPNLSQMVGPNGNAWDQRLFGTLIFCNDQELKTSLTKMVISENPFIRRAVLDYLPYIDDKTALKLYKQLLKDSEESVAITAMQNLYKIPEDERAAIIYEVLENDLSKEKMVAAAELIGKASPSTWFWLVEVAYRVLFSNPKQFSGLLETMYRTASSENKNDFGLYLLTYHPEEIGANNDTDSTFYQDIIETMAASDPQRETGLKSKYLEQLIASPYKWVRRYAVYWFARSEDFGKLLSSPDYRVRYAALVSGNRELPKNIDAKEYNDAYDYYHQK